MIKFTVFYNPKYVANKLSLHDLSHLELKIFHLQLCIFKHIYFSLENCINNIANQINHKADKIYSFVCMCSVTELKNCGKRNSYVHALRSTTQYKHQQNLLTAISNK